MNNTEVKFSKFLSLILRHKPEIIGIQLHKNGWTDVDTLLKNANNYGKKIDKKTLLHIVETNPKKRFSLNNACNKIRVNQGHSINVDLGYISQKPPEILYHGTGEKSVNSIFKTGLEKHGRQHVHLSDDIEIAIKVGQRHGTPFVFKVAAKEMYNSKFEFYLSENGVWLTDNVQ